MSGPEPFKCSRPPVMCRPRPMATGEGAGSRPRCRQLRRRHRGPRPGRPLSLTSRGLPGGGAGVPVPGLSRAMTGGASVRKFTTATSRTISGAVVCGGCGLWRQVPARGGPAAWKRACVGGGRPERGANSCRNRPACPTVTRSIKLNRTLGSSVDRLAVPKNRGNSRDSGRGRASFGRVALGVGWV